jgi:streptogramin lyase
MRIRERLLIGVICLAPSLAAQTWPVNPARIKGAGQDSVGQVWAIGYAPTLGLYRWENEQWRAVPIEGLPGNAQPMAAASGSDGAVYCVWSAGLNVHPVTRHQGTASLILAQFTGALADSPSIFVDSHGNVWITERGPHIYRVTPQGRAECIYTIPDEDYLSTRPLRAARPLFNPVHATADGLGRIWFWSGGMVSRSGLMTLRQILIFDGDGFKPVPQIAGESREAPWAVEPDGPDHMWVAIPDDQLYQVDTKTLVFAPVVEPENQAFRRVQRIFAVGQETFLISNSALRLPEPGGEGRFSALWRLKKDAWERVVNGIDMAPEVTQDPERVLVAVPEGFWAGANGSGPWFIPSGQGAPVHIDWHYGWPFDKGQAIFHLPDGRLLLIALNQGSIAMKPADLMAAFQSPAGIRTLNPVHTFVQDRRGHFWGLLTSADSALSEWDGSSWKQHALPEDFSDARRYSFAADSDDHIWLVINPCEGFVTVFDSVQGTFQTYPDFPTALQAQLPRHPKFSAENRPQLVPSFTPDGRIGYSDPCMKLHYFDGQAWQSWNLQEVARDSRPFLNGRAFFDQAGNFAVDIEGSTWEYADKTGWHITTSEPGVGLHRALGPPPTVLPPSGCDFSNPESIAQDRLGTYWMTYRSQLYRAIPGLCLPQTSPAEHQPFIDGRSVKAALIDPKGSAFLETYLHAYPNVGEYVIVSARQPLPTTQMQASVDAGGTVKLRFGPPTKGKAWFTWRVDGEAWSHPAQGEDAAIPGLAVGKHRIEAAAIDERLQIDPNPAVAEVEIHAVDQSQLAALIEQLKDPDFSVRDAAVAGLARQPELALPLLQSARETAAPDQRWWIDATIQRIKEQTSTKKEP